MSDVTCSRCFLPIHQDEALEHKGMYTSHRPDRCSELLRAENKALALRLHEALGRIAEMEGAPRKLANLTRYLAEQADESPFTREEWDRVDKQTTEYVRRIADLEAEVKSQGCRLSAHPNVDDLLAKHGWMWRDNASHADLTELYDDKGQMLAWIHKRPGYCDRGHWQAQVECVPSLDEADQFPRYFMRIEIAKQELVEFIAWRLFKSRVVETSVHNSPRQEIKS